MQIEPNIQTVKFGDGYEQRIRNGLNANAEKWSVKFTNVISEISQIDAFLKARGGAEAFNWTTPMNTSAIFVCKSWQVNKLVPEVAELSATFERVFG